MEWGLWSCYGEKHKNNFCALVETYNLPPQQLPVFHPPRNTAQEEAPLDLRYCPSKGGALVRLLSAQCSRWYPALPSPVSTATPLPACLQPVLTLPWNSIFWVQSSCSQLTHCSCILHISPVWRIHWSPGWCQVNTRVQGCGWWGQNEKIYHP